ncbi:MAG: response regulator, partial [Acidobacteria bacterium]|nr:response regulator [Acidobacteriota bacterium]
LIADDEAHIRRLMSQSLEELEDRGVELLTASDGAMALEIIRAERPALVFLDLMMPRMNGFDVCQAVKADAGLRNTYVVMLTAKGQNADRQKGLQSGADLYMTKPFDPDELLEISARVLGIAPQ